MRKIIVLFIFSAFLSCKEKDRQPSTPSSEGTRAFTEQLDFSSNRTVTLTPEARGQVNDWLAYATAQNEIESLKLRTGKEIMATSNNLVQIMESLNNTVPDTLRSKSLLARANVLLTKSKVLHQLSTKKDKNADEVFEVANDLIVEFDNFKIQVNELFLKTPGDFEIELDQEFEDARQQEEDSIPHLDFVE